MENMTIIPLSKAELLATIQSSIEDAISQDRENHYQDHKYWTAQEVADHFKVTLMTVSAWAKQGILTKYRIGRRVLYKRVEVLKAPIKLEY